MSGMWVSSRPKGWPHGFQKRGGAIFFGMVAMFGLMCRLLSETSNYLRT